MQTQRTALRSIFPSVAISSSVPTPTTSESVSTPRPLTGVSKSISQERKMESCRQNLQSVRDDEENALIENHFKRFLQRTFTLRPFKLDVFQRRQQKAFETTFFSRAHFRNSWNSTLASKKSLFVTRIFTQINTQFCNSKHKSAKIQNQTVQEWKSM